VLKDGKIDADEYKLLLAFFDEFVTYQDNEWISSTSHGDNYNTTGIFANDPDIIIKGKKFCFAGNQSKTKKKKLEATINELGGLYTDDIQPSSSYLAIGEGGNLTRVFACYGRKVEIAIEMRKKGRKSYQMAKKHQWIFRSSMRLIFRKLSRNSDGKVLTLKYFFQF
jgi:hypothetical protein